MSSSYGQNIRINIFGQSHSPAIGVNIEGLPAGEKIDMEALAAFLARRAPGRNSFSTGRREDDLPEFLSGLVGDTTCGAPLAAIIRNNDARSRDYSALKTTPRPGHADLTAEIKYGGYQDYAGGGHFSGRLTAPLCIAGGICLQLLKKEGIEVMARIKSIGAVEDGSDFESPVAEKQFPASDASAAEAMLKLIADAKAEGDSVGGVVECIIKGAPAGLGDPMFMGLENRIASIVFGIPAVKGIEFGAGFRSALMRGSENNDPYIAENGSILTSTNNSGGILGGISNGMPIVFRAAFKPTPSIGKTQKSVDMTTGKECELNITGRHDPCVVPRAVPCVEAAAAIAVYDAVLEQRKYRR